MKELNETIKTILLEHKNQAYVIDDSRYGFSLGDDYYKIITGIDLETLSMIWGETHVYGEVRYCKKDEGYELQYETFINDESKDSLSGVIVAPDYSQDWLGMFSTDVVMTENNIKAWLKGETEVDGDTLSNFEIIMKIINEEHHDKFMDYLSDYGVGNVPDGLKEKCAMDYIHVNPLSACHESIDYMSSYDIKDVIKSMLDSL